MVVMEVWEDQQGFFRHMWKCLNSMGMEITGLRVLLVIMELIWAHVMCLAKQA